MIKLKLWVVCDHFRMHQLLQSVPNNFLIPNNLAPAYITSHLTAYQHSRLNCALQINNFSKNKHLNAELRTFG